MPLRFRRRGSGQSGARGPRESTRRAGQREQRQPVLGGRQRIAILEDGSRYVLIGNRRSKATVIRFHELCPGIHVRRLGLPNGFAPCFSSVVETAILAILTALLGAVAGGFLRERGDREALLRDRRLAAADDFLAAALEVFIRLTSEMERNAFPGLEDSDEADAWFERMDAIRAEARDQAHNATRRAARLELLFGRESPTASAAMQLLVDLLQMTEVVKSRDPDATVRFEEVFDSANGAMARFTTLAYAAITAPRWWEHPFSLRNRRTPDSMPNGQEELTEGTAASGGVVASDDHG